MGFFRWLWSFSGEVWTYTATQSRWARNSGTLWFFLFFLFFIAFAVAWICGYPPSVAYAWFDAHLDKWMLILWRIFWGLVLLVCAILVFGVFADLFGRRIDEAKDEPRNYRSGGCMLVAIAVVCYIGWVAITLQD